LQPPPTGAPALQVDSAYGYLLGIFPVNLLHNLVHLLVGVLGIVSARALNSARAYSRGVAIVFGVLTVMGLLPEFNTTFGLIPLFGSDVALHAVTTVAAAYFGWFASDARRVRTHAVAHAN
jgi:hypothetical protein